MWVGGFTGRVVMLSRVARNCCAVSSVAGLGAFCSPIPGAWCAPGSCSLGMNRYTSGRVSTTYKLCRQQRATNQTPGWVVQAQGSRCSPAVCQLGPSGLCSCCTGGCLSKHGCAASLPVAAVGTEQQGLRAAPEGRAHFGNRGRVVSRFWMACSVVQPTNLILITDLENFGLADRMRASQVQEDV